MCFKLYDIKGTLSGTPCAAVWIPQDSRRIRYLPTACPRDSLASAALRHGAPRILGWVLLPSAAKKKGLPFSRLRLTLSHHVICVSKNNKFKNRSFFLPKRSLILLKKMVELKSPLSNNAQYISISTL